MSETNVVNQEKIFNKIKKNNGEINAQRFRDLFGIPNIVDILEFAGKDEEELAQVHRVLKEIYKPEEKSQVFVKEDPLTLLDKAGYKAWYVENEQDQNSIAGYFRSQKAVDYGMTGGYPRTNVGYTENGELLCTVYQNWDDGLKRFDSDYIIHAVKKEVLGDDKLPESQWHIKPSVNPERQDEYGTSVISIQIAKPKGGYISIKNRYNHTVIDPDNTFDSNPDRIIPGLSNALKAHFGVEFTTTNTPLPPNFRMIHDRVVRYNFERDNVCFGPNYYFIGSNLVELNNDYEYMLDYYILDRRTGELRYPGPEYQAEDNTIAFFNKMLKNKKIEVKTNKKQKSQKTIFVDGVQFMVVENGQIVELNLQDVKELPDWFMSGNTTLRTLIAPKLEKTGQDFLVANNALTKLILPELVSMGQYSLRSLNTLTEINTPKAKELGHLSIASQSNLKKLNVPELPDRELDMIYDWAHTEIKMLIAAQRLRKSMNAEIKKAKEKTDKQIDDLKSKTDEQFSDLLWKYMDRLD